jgi:hypothetical protein
MIAMEGCQGANLGRDNEIKTGVERPQNRLRHTSNLRQLNAQLGSNLRPVLSAVPQAFLLSLLRFDPLPLLF